MADEQPGPMTHSPQSSANNTKTEDTIQDFIYRENKNILNQQEVDSQRLNQKAAQLMRLLGVIFTLYSGASFVAARISTNPGSNLELSLFFNEYIIASLGCLAAGFLSTILAYHKTTIASGPSAEYLRNDITDDLSVDEGKKKINKKVPGWVRSNKREIGQDHTRLFISKMCIFFSLSYLVIGTTSAESISEFSNWNRLIAATVVIIFSYIIYTEIRTRASSDDS